MTDLSVILGPEHYDDGVSYPAPRPRDASSRSADMSSPDELHREKRSGTGEGGEGTGLGKGGGGRKRARGRPRVEPKDHTAADVSAPPSHNSQMPPTSIPKANMPKRRRTQIRLAQRAYRNRKETAIQTLEKKVSSLQDSNEEMSRAFMSLYDAAVAQGLLVSAPSFGRELQATTERFVALAKRAGDAESVDGGGSAGSERLSDEPEAAWSAERHARSTSGDAVFGAGSASPEQPVSSTWSEARRATYPFGDITPPSAPNYLPAIGPRSTDTIALRPNPLSTTHPLGMSPGISPLLAPPSHTHQERTFGRRLQRSALEQGLLLLHLPSPPPHIYAGVFGFCLLFESRDDIVKRVTDAISRDPRRTLDCWDRPFWHLGGAGSFFGFVRGADFSDESTSSDEYPPVGNQGSEGLRPDRSLGSAMGPFGPEVEEVRDMRVDRRMRMLVPGFEGDFFDPDEVEVFLRRRGVYIPPASDFVTAEIDVADFVLEGAEGGVSCGTTDPALSVQGDVPTSYPSGFPDGGLGTPMEAVLDPAHTADADPFAAFGSGGLPSLDAIDFDFSSLPYMSAFGKAPTRRKVTINVTTLVEGACALMPLPMPNITFDYVRRLTSGLEMTQRAVCLGRSPGIRPKDVVSSFWAACSWE